ncbi:hypothetical protein S83_041593 [Arachis hypogaea]
MAVIDDANPFLLHSFDQPNLALVTQMLTGDNYPSWKRSMEMALNGKNKLGFVDGTILPPEEGASHSFKLHWHRLNDIVSTWILNSVSKEIASSLIFAGSAHEIWIDLGHRFQQKNRPRIYELRKELINLKQDSLSISQFFTKLKCVWEELCHFRPSVHCNCGGAREFLAHADEEYVLVFLMGLNDVYHQVRSQILLMKPLPSISEVFSLIVQEERQRGLTLAPPTSNETQLAFAVKNTQYNSKIRPGKKDKPLCAQCGLLSHTKDKCYKLHGYPPNYKKQSPATVRVNHVDTSQDIPLQLTSQQYQQLISLLSTQVPSTMPPIITAEASSAGEGKLFSAALIYALGVKSWILDSGATCHVTCTLDNFKPSIWFANKFVVLPDHTRVPVLASGPPELQDDWER